MPCSQFILFDLECDGFYPNNIFVICVYDLVYRTRHTYTGIDEIASAIERMLNAKMVAGHFIAGFDLPVIKRLAGAEVVKERVIDTVKLSRELCDLPNHKLKTWGELVGLPKMDAPLFEQFSPEMVPYCERDVDVNVRVFDFLVELLVERGEVEQYPVLVEYLEAVNQNIPT